MNDHVDIHLMELLDGELEPQRAALVQEHLKTCVQCEAELEELRRGHALALALPRWSPPDRVWDGVLAQVREAQGSNESGDRGSSAGMQGRPRRRARWPRRGVLAGAVAAAVALVLLLPRGDSRVPLDSYLSLLETKAGFSTEVAPGKFRGVPRGDALTAAGITAAGGAEPPRISPLSGYHMQEGRVRRVRDAQVVQLVFAGDQAPFAVFMAPHAAELDFGDRTRTRVQIGDWRCTQVESDELAVYWAVSSDRQSVLVASADAALDVAKVLGFFVYGGWEEKEPWEEPGGDR